MSPSARNAATKKRKSVFKAGDLEFVSRKIQWSVQPSDAGLVCDLNVECDEVPGEYPYEPVLYFEQLTLAGVGSLEEALGKSFPIPGGTFTVYTFEHGGTHRSRLKVLPLDESRALLEIRGTAELGILGDPYGNVEYVAEIPVPLRPRKSGPTASEQKAEETYARSRDGLAYRLLKERAGHFKANERALVLFIRTHLKAAQPALIAGLSEQTLTTVVTVLLNTERQLGMLQEPSDLMGAVIMHLRRRQGALESSLRKP
jgi:hypothetical protein